MNPPSSHLRSYADCPFNCFSHVLRCVTPHMRREGDRIVNPAHPRHLFCQDPQTGYALNARQKVCRFRRPKLPIGCQPLAPMLRVANLIVRARHFSRPDAPGRIAPRHRVEFGSHCDQPCQATLARSERFARASLPRSDFTHGWALPMNLLRLSVVTIVRPASRTKESFPSASAL